MQAITPSHRVVLADLSLMAAGDRVLVRGLEPDRASAQLATAVRRAGVAAELHTDDGPRTLRGLARGIAVRRADVILTRLAGEASPALATAWVAALRSECPGARLIVLSDGRDAPPSADVTYGADGRAAVTDHAAVLALLAPEPATGPLPAPESTLQLGIVACDPESGPVAPADVIAQLRRLDRRSARQATVVLHGLLDVLEDGDLLNSLAALRLRRITPVVAAEVAEVGPERATTLAAHGVGLQLTLITTGSFGDAEHTRSVLEPAVLAGVPVSVHVRAMGFEPGLESVADVLRAFAPGFTFEVDGHSDGFERDDVREVLAPGSATADLEQAISRRAGSVLQHALCGARRDAVEPQGATGIVWRDPEVGAEGAAWLAQTLQLDGSVWMDRDTAESSPWPAYPIDGDLLGGAGATATFGDDGEIEVLPYHVGRSTVPYGPLVLSIAGLDDLDALARDADHARASGEFPPALTYPLTAVGESTAFGGPGSPGDDVSRLIVQDGSVRTGAFSPPLGRVGESHAVLAARAQERRQDREERLGCARCPIAAVCARSNALDTLIGEAAYCELRRQRPWLPLFVALPALLRRALAGGPPGAAEATADVRVSGFGGPLFYDGLPSECDPPPGVAVLEVGDDYFLADVTTGRCARLTTDLARLVDALLASGSAGRTIDWLVGARNVSAEVAAGAVDRALGLLTTAGVSLNAGIEVAA